MSDIINTVVAGYEQSYSDVRTTDEPRVMLILGDFEFSIDTATFNQLTREASWRWGEQERIGQADLLQYTGKSARTVKIEGEAHALFRNGVDAINELYFLADEAKPHQLVSGVGDVLGWWVITDFSDANTSFLPGGGPRKKTYSMTIKHYADDLSNP
jgi:hypothetical protein